MNSFELITKYLPAALDKYFFEDGKSTILEQGTKFVDVNFNETGYVKIASMLMDGLSNYYSTQSDFAANAANSGEFPNYAAYAGNINEGARDGFAIGGATLTWEIFRLQYKRGRQFRIDYIEDEESAGVVIGNIVEEFSRVKVVPEVDATRFSIIADTASVSLGNLTTETISANQIIGKFNGAFEWLAEHEVPEEEQVIFVNPAVMTLIRNTTELTKFLTQGDYRSAAGLNFTVEKYGGRPIIVVPTNRFFNNILVTDNGYRPNSGSKVINFMVVSKKAVVPIRKLEYSKVYNPEQSGVAGFYGYIFNYLIYHGVVIPQNKVVGCYVSLAETNATTKVATLSIDTVAGATQYAWKLRNYYTNPAALRGYIAYKDSAFTLGGDISSVGTLGTDYKIATPGVDIAEAAGSKSYYFAVVDAMGKIIAVSGSVAVTQHA
jgi:hypothetical protein